MIDLGARGTPTSTASPSGPGSESGSAAPGRSASRPGAATRPARRLAVRRVPLLIGAMCSLIAGLWGALALLGLDTPLPRQTFAAEHGPLMAMGFLGTLISLERSVALARPWAYAAPALSALGALALAHGSAGLGRLLITAAAGWLIAVYLVLYRRRHDRDLIVQLSGAISWYAGGLLWLSGRPVSDLVPWLAGFLVLTIAGERLELARVAFLRRRVTDGLLATAAVLALGVIITAVRPEIGWRVAGLGMIALSGWLAVHDVARRTVRGKGLPRFAAVCLLAGYAWLAVAGVIWLAAGLPTGGTLYDAALHGLFLGFVMSMVFGHAPVILPAVLRVKLPYHPVLYVPLALLHLSLVIRVAGDLTGVLAARTAGGVLGEIALLSFVLSAVAANRLTRRSAARTASARAAARAARAASAGAAARTTAKSAAAGPDPVSCEEES